MRTPLQKRLQTELQQNLVRLHSVAGGFPDWDGLPFGDASVPAFAQSAALYIDFRKRLAARAGTVFDMSKVLSCKRGAEGTAPDSAGAQVSFAKDIPKITNTGLHIASANTANGPDLTKLKFAMTTSLYGQLKGELLSNQGGQSLFDFYRTSESRRAFSVFADGQGAVTPHIHYGLSAQTHPNVAQGWTTGSFEFVFSLPFTGAPADKLRAGFNGGALSGLANALLSIPGGWPDAFTFGRGVNQLSFGDDASTRTGDLVMHELVVFEGYPSDTELQALQS